MQSGRWGRRAEGPSGWWGTGRVELGVPARGGGTAAAPGLAEPHQLKPSSGGGSRGGWLVGPRHQASSIERRAAQTEQVCGCPGGVGAPKAQIGFDSHLSCCAPLIKRALIVLGVHCVIDVVILHWFGWRMGSQQMDRLAAVWEPVGPSTQRTRRTAALKEWLTPALLRSLGSASTACSRLLAAAATVRTSQPGGFAALLFCASCTTVRISASVCRGGGWGCVWVCVWGGGQAVTPGHHAAQGWV